MNFILSFLKGLFDCFNHTCLFYFVFFLSLFCFPLFASPPVFSLADLERRSALLHNGNPSINPFLVKPIREATSGKPLEHISVYPSSTEAPEKIVRFWSEELQTIHFPPNLKSKFFSEQIALLDLQGGPNHCRVSEKLLELIIYYELTHHVKKIKLKNFYFNIDLMKILANETFPKLTDIHFQNCHITSSVAAYLKSMISSDYFKQFENFSLDFVSFDSSKDVASIFNALGQVKNLKLRSLNLAGLEMDHHHFALLVPLFKNAVSLKAIDLSHTEFNSKILNQLFHIMNNVLNQRTQPIEELYFSHYIQNLDEFLEFSQFLTAPSMRYVKKLDIACNQLEVSLFGKELVRVLKNHGSLFANLEFLSIAGHRMCDSQLAVFIRLLADNCQKLRVLDLSKNYLSEKSLRSLVKHFAKFQNIEKLSFNHSFIFEISPGLLNLFLTGPRLTFLDLRNNEISNDTFKMIKTINDENSCTILYTYYDKKIYYLHYSPLPGFPASCGFTKTPIENSEEVYKTNKTTSANAF